MTTRTKAKTVSDAPADALVVHLFARCTAPKCWNMHSLQGADKALAATEAMGHGWRWVDGAWQCPECATDGR